MPARGRRARRARPGPAPPAPPRQAASQSAASRKNGGLSTPARSSGGTRVCPSASWSMLQPERLYQSHFVEILHNPSWWRLRPPLWVLPSGAPGRIAVVERIPWRRMTSKRSTARRSSVGSGGAGSVGLGLLLAERLGRDLHRAAGGPRPGLGGGREQHLRAARGVRQAAPGGQRPRSGASLTGHRTSPKRRTSTCYQHADGCRNRPVEMMTCAGGDCWRCRRQGCF
jgi:hypothetical protein